MSMSLKKVAESSGIPYEEVKQLYRSAIKKMEDGTGIKGPKLIKAIREAIKNDPRGCNK
jgi:hypothetical protein